ncbi:MAG TPA: COX15/CtaA family protein [Bacillota bacterium]|nr:COX15/CtaA family protein [Bacillota bacterium]
MSTKSVRYFRLTLWATIFMFIAEFSGFVDTFTGSISGCGTDYPFCNGKLYPNFSDYHSVIEYTHRILVFCASMLLIVVSILIWRHYKQKKMKLLILFSLSGIIFESFLGAIAVIYTNPPELIATHLGTALLSFAGLLSLTATLAQMKRGAQWMEVEPSFKKLSWFTFAYFFVEIYFGAYVASTGSGGAFQGFPFPTESLENVGRAFWLDVLHRSFAVGLLILTYLLMSKTKKYKHTRRELYVESRLTFGIVWLQAFSGALLVYTHLSLWSILVHVFLVTLLYGLLSLMGVQSLAKPEAQTSGGQIRESA